MSVGAVGSSNDYQYQQAEQAQQNQQAQQNTEAAGGANEAAATQEEPVMETAGETSSATSTSSTSATEPKKKSDELCEGKGKQAGTVDYFDGASVITDADTVVDIAKCFVENNASNMSPEKLAGLLSEKGYNVQLVQMGNRKAIQFENGDFFYDSDGDGNLGTKDQNFQSALTMVEQNYGVDLSELKNSKYTAYHKYSEIGKGKDLSGVSVKVLKTFGAFEGRDLNFEAQNKGSLSLPGQGGGEDGGAAAADAADAAKALDEAKQAEAEAEAQAEEEQEVNEETLAMLDELDEALEAAGYRGDKSAYEAWMDGELSNLLAQYDISEPSLPESSADFADSMAIFGAAISVAAYREA
ncbi:MAG: hypothetical protein Q4F00_02785 [bacterium]|nr:hypothetical protein [bacterium]